MKRGDLVVTRRLPGGAEFVARLAQAHPTSHGVYALIDARGVRHWRRAEEFRLAPQDGDAPPLSAEPDRPGKPPAVAYGERKRQALTFLERAGLATVWGVAREIGATYAVAHQALGGLERDGRARRVGLTNEDRPQVLWGSAERAAS